MSMDDFEDANPFQTDVDASPNLPHEPLDQDTQGGTSTLSASVLSEARSLAGTVDSGSLETEGETETVSRVAVSEPTSPQTPFETVHHLGTDEDAYGGGFGAAEVQVDDGGDDDEGVGFGSRTAGGVGAVAAFAAEERDGQDEGRGQQPMGSAFPPAGTGPARVAPRPKTEFCCSKDRWLHSGEDIEILIVDAQKTSLNATSPYITYVIQCGSTRSHHRYSEFESLRSSLAKLHPTLIVPPIPSKQPLSEYAVKQAKAKEDIAMIARRKRMLQTFLNRISKHPILSNDHVFHRFLEGEVSWSEVLHSAPLSLLPKSLLKAPPQDPTDQSASPAYQALPTPSPSHPVRQADQRFQDSEAFTNKFSSHLSGPMEKVTRRALRRWTDLAQDHAELGAALNGFSLSENGELSAAIEKTGQAIDATYISTSKLAQELEQNWMEPLHEYTQFGSIIKKLLQFRHQKHVQYEMTQDALEHKRAQLEEMEKSEREAQRLAEALGRGRTATEGGMSRSESAAGAFGGEEGAGGEEGEGGDTAYGQSHSTPSYIPSHPGPNPVRRRAPGMGLLNALSYTLHGMMDADPETARRNGITRTRDNIAQLEEALRVSAQDLKFTSVTIQGDLDRFQRQKVSDLREMCISLARGHRDWCQKNLEAWEEAKRQIDEIPDHPNQMPPEEAAAAAAATPTAPVPHAKVATASARRDSNATVNGR